MHEHVIPDEPSISATAQTQPGLSVEVIQGRRYPLPAWSRWDVVLVLTGFLLTLAVSLGIGRSHIFWIDEMLGWMMLHDPSWRHMVSSWKQGADGGGFAFYLTGRFWFAIFGASEASFRLYSATCFGVAFAATWAAGRRFYRTGPLAFAVFNTFFFSPALLTHMAEGRFYGLLMACVCLAICFFIYTVDLSSASAGVCLLAFLIHAALTTSHLLGIVYSASLLLGMVALDLSVRRLRPQLYLSIMAAWLLLIPSRSAILASAAVGKPHFWTSQPPFNVFMLAYSGFSLRIAGVLLLLLLALAVRLALAPDRVPLLREAFAARKPIYVATLMIFLVPVAFVMEGMVGPALFTDRYLIPVNAAVSFFTAEMVTLIDPRRFFRGKAWKPVLALVLLGYLAVMANYDFNYIGNFVIQHENYTGRVTARLPKGIPVVCEDIFSFTELLPREHASGVRYTYLLDWQNALDPHIARSEVTDYHLMENWKKAGYFSGSIEYRDKFLQQHPYFLVLHTEEFTVASVLHRAHSINRENRVGNPLVKRFKADPAYQVKLYTTIPAGTLEESIWLVCRRSIPVCDPAALGIPLPGVEASPAG